LEEVTGRVLGTLLTFAAAVAVLAVVPGPSTAVILRRSILSGRRSGVATVIGDDLGALIWGAAAALGLSALLVASHVAYDVLRIAGAAFLVAMGVRALWPKRWTRSRPTDRRETDERAVPEASPWQSVRLGLMTNLANPKAGVFAMSFLPQFVPRGAPALPAMLVLSVLWVLIDASWGLTLVWAAHRLRRTLQRSAVQRWLDRASGAVLVGLGLRLAFEAR
jgi:threonine/homoserine/homoserine lactone efflux protein